MNADEKQYKITSAVTAMAMIDKECRARGMSRSEFMVRAALTVIGVSPFTDTEVEAIRDIVKEELGKPNK